MRISDWSSDVCSSDLVQNVVEGDGLAPVRIVAGVVADGFGVGDVLRHHPPAGALRAHARGGDLEGVDKVQGRPPFSASRSQDQKSTRLNSSHYCAARMPSSACKTKRK